MANNINFGAMPNLMQDSFSIKQTATISRDCNIEDQKIGIVSTDTEIGMPNFGIVKINATLSPSNNLVGLGLIPVGASGVTEFSLGTFYSNKNYTLFYPFLIFYNTFNDTSIRVIIGYASDNYCGFNFEYNLSNDSMIVTKDNLALRASNGRFNGIITINFYQFSF